MKYINALLGGDVGCGKSNLLLRISDNKFVEQYISTIGTDFKVINLENNAYALRMVDYVSHDHIDSFDKSIIKNTFIVLFLFDLSNLNSFNNIDKYIYKLNQSNPTNSIHKILIGTKLDLIQQHPQYNKQFIDYSKNLNIPYIEISSKENININQLLSTILNIYKDNETTPTQLDDKNNITLSNKNRCTIS